MPKPKRKTKLAPKRIREAVLVLNDWLKKRGTNFLHVRVVDEGERGKRIEAAKRTETRKAKRKADKAERTANRAREKARIKEEKIKRQLKQFYSQTHCLRRPEQGEFQLRRILREE